MDAVILLAGTGSRLNRSEVPHKSLLRFGDETLLSRHLSCLQELGIACAHLVLGHNQTIVRDYAQGLGLDLPLHFIDNERYRTTGNTLSMVLGLRHCRNDALIMDGDVLYPRSVFLDYVRRAPASSFAVVPSDIHNEEAAKVLLRPDGTIQAFVTKRAFTLEERNGFPFGGEAIGFFKLSADHVARFLDLYDRHEAEYETALWEIPFTEFSKEVPLQPWTIPTHDCFEIDTPEEYEYAREQYCAHRGRYG
ncbi:MAG: NTP transferase domain-containing protein [Nitrospinaceae bacterium]|nr:NTP transferase domain-containing protein [Nitrospinaceae bacterium]NIR53705.1 NTP transferase domain-containing protein [Nitrospinaceae bacterium]NIS84113.1 NTP transferase domain-containing protein [Nitrospinaceae bacterium]NIT83075.1 NTP transferase domain-containing protein [Nitrospinaceae bacterium]NIU45285.1 NTP transferase domain-containing protein [Nitrospinaceae bacterium]